MFDPWTVSTSLFIHVGTSDTAREKQNRSQVIADWGQQ